MPCLPDSELNNYLLGRISDSDREVRTHLAECKKCRQRMYALERELQNEAMRLQEQSRTFGLTARPQKKKAG